MEEVCAANPAAWFQAYVPGETRAPVHLSRKVEVDLPHLTLQALFGLLLRDGTDAHADAEECQVTTLKTPA